MKAKDLIAMLEEVGEPDAEVVLCVQDHHTIYASVHDELDLSHDGYIVIQKDKEGFSPDQTLPGAS